MEGPRANAGLIHRAAHQDFADVVQLALANDFARFAGPVGGEFFVIDARHVDALRVSKRSSSGPEIRF